MPPPSPPTSAPFACPHCPSRFGKALKLDRHLLDVHHASLRLSPSPDSLPPRVSAQLARAVAEANACFARAHPACPRCDAPADRKPFRNVRDLAQHLLGKHADDDRIDMSQGDPPHPDPRADSEISCKRKRDHQPVHPTLHPDTPAAPVDADSAHDRKRRRTTAPAVSPATPPKPHPQQHPASPANSEKSPGVSLPARDSPPKSHPSHRRSASDLRPAAASPARRHSAPSAHNPPTVTPNKPPKPAPAQPCMPQLAPCLANAAIRLPPNALLTTAPMNFCGFAGFAPLSGKSYYKLSDR